MAGFEPAQFSSQSLHAVQANGVGEQCCCDEPRRQAGRGFGVEGRVSCAMQGSVLQSDELWNNSLLPRQLHQGQMLSVLKDALERSSCSYDHSRAPELPVFR